MHKVRLSRAEPTHSYKIRAEKLPRDQIWLVSMTFLIAKYDAF